MSESNGNDSYDTIRWDFEESTGIGTVVLDRPDTLNAMSARALRELEDAFDRFESLDRSGDSVSVRAVVLEGAGDRAFSSGVDLDEIGEEHYPYTSQTFRDALFAVAEYGAPVIAKIDGYCVGGGMELALLCDFRIASERSELGFPEVDLGIFPSTVGTTQRVPRLVGPSRAKELFMTGEFVSGSQANEEGLVDHAYPGEDLDAEVESFARDLADKPPLAIRAIKDTVDRSLEVGVADGTEYEYRAYLPLLHTDDYEEGAAAWAEDREPEWEGR